MKRVSLKLAVGFAAFIIGIVGTAIWFFEPFSLETLEEVPLVQDETIIDDQCAVYSVLINELILKDNKTLDRLQIADQTSFYENTGYLSKMTTDARLSKLKEWYPGLDEELLEDFDAKQCCPSELSPKFNIPVLYKLINEKEAEKKRGSAAALMIKFSQVGFNRERTMAFVEIEYYCPLCGFGSHILLEKQNGRWKIKQEFNGWVS